MSKHTPEPWVFESEPKYCSEIFGSNCEPICTFLDEPSAVDVDRILSCVNACAGMEDPAAEIAELKQQRDELLAALRDAAKALDELGRFHFSAKYWSSTAYSAIEKAKGSL